MTDRPTEGRVPRARRGIETHYEQAKQDLEALAVHLAADGTMRLPAEDRLAAQLGFSRPTIRSALLALQKEGKVLRRHGLGTFINRHALGIDANLAEDRPFLQVIERLGYKASVEIAGMVERPLPRDIGARAGGCDGEPGIVIDRLFRASGEPAVLSRDYLPTERMTAPFAELAAERSTFEFVERWTTSTVRYSVADIRAVAADEGVAASLHISPATPVLLIDHRHIDQHDQPIGVTTAFVRDDLIGFSVVRAGTDL